MFINGRRLIAFFIAVSLIIASVNAQTDKYIIVYKDHAQKQRTLKHPRFKMSREFTIIPAVAAQLDANQVKQLREDSNVAYIEPDYKIHALGGPSAAAEVSSRDIKAPSSPQAVPYGITMVNASLVWPKTKGDGIRIAVLDTGISMYHPDRGNVVASVSFATDDTGAILPVEDFDGHGTHVAGTIAAADNTIGVVGVAPQADLLIAKVLDNEGYGNTSDLISGIEWAVSNDAKVINMSLGGYSNSTTLNTACNNAFAAGVLLVAAAGNDGKSTPTYPAALSSVISVAAVDSDQKKARFSNYGSDIEFAAPGVDVYSTVCPVDVASSTGPTADAVWNSTSHDANVVTGTAAGTVSGLICDCGLATGEDPQNTCPDSVLGNIAYIQRGTNYFSEKVAHARSKGAIGVIIANNVAGNFLGTLGDGSPLVVVAISQSDGTSLRSLIPSNIIGTVSVDATLYEDYDGTSMACPHVAGVAALLFAAEGGDISPSEVRMVLQNSAQDLGASGRDNYFGYGLVDAEAAMGLISTFTISGTTGIDGVIMRGLPGNPITSGGGFYTAAVPYNWDGMVTPTKARYTFTPPSTSYVDVAADFNDQDYTADANGQSFPMTTTQCSIKAGKTRTVSTDSFSITGISGVSQQDITGSIAIYARLSNASETIFEGTIPYNYAKFKNGKYSYTRRKDDPINICSGSFDLNKKTFRITAKGIDLTGLNCPVHVELEWGGYWGTAEANETIVNGKSPIPMPLLKGYADALRIDKASVRIGKNPGTDSLTIKGAIAFASAAEDLTQHQLTLHWGTQDFIVPAGGFVASTNGRYAYASPKGTTVEITKAGFDLEKCTFTFSVKNATITSRTNPVACGITCDAFDQTSPYTLP